MFRGRTDAATFAAAAGWVNALFVGVTIAFPFLLYWLLSISGCQRVGGACGALGLVLAIYIKPMIYIAYVLSFLGLAWRRLRDAGLPSVLALGLFVLMLSDVQWGLVMGSPWSVGFATGFRGGFPRALMAGLACVAALSMLPAWGSGGSHAVAGEDGRRTLSPAAMGLIVLMMIVAVASLITIATTMFGGMIVWYRLLYAGPFSFIHQPASLAVAATPLLIVPLCYREWLAMGRPGNGSPWAAAIAVCVAIIAVGSAVGVVLGAWTWVAQLLGIRGGWQTVTAILNWTAMPELLALLVLPWLLRFLPAAPAASTEPAAPPPRGTQPGPVAFGRRGVA